MTRLEKFGLVSGIIGLIADIIGLTIFFAGVLTPQYSNSNAGELPFVYQAIIAFTIIYGWLSISWVLVRKSFVQRKLSKKSFIRVAFTTVFGMGVIVIPLVIAWWIAIAQGDAIRQQAEIDKREKVKATQTAQAILTSVVSSTPEVNRQFTLERDRVDTSGYFCIAPLIHIATGVGLFVFLVLIMPMVYHDMPEVTIIDLLILLPRS